MAPRLPPTTGVPLVMEPLSVPAALTRLDPELEPLTAPAAAPPIVPETLSLVPLARPPQAAMARKTNVVSDHRAWFVENSAATSGMIAPNGAPGS
jgi:hypothetical protein